MENKVEILNELRELSLLLAGMEKINVFTVPVGYFENLCDDILTGLSSEKGSAINSFFNSFPADVPQGYFDTLADDILNKIKAQDASVELRTLSPLLYSIQHENVFETPAGYFDTLADAVVTRVKPQQAIVVSMSRRSTSFMKYAVAAAFTGVMALGVFKFVHGNKDSVDTVVAQGMQIAKENKFNEELAKISNDEIVKYLEANGSDVKTALVATSVDENELPSQEDYLMDDKALDKYLNSINVTDLKN